MLSILNLRNKYLVSIKEINRLITKGMYVLLFDIFNEFPLVQLKK